MKTQQTEFTVVTKNNVIQAVGRSVIYQPVITDNKREMKWFDDNTLIKKDKN